MDSELIDAITEAEVTRQALQRYTETDAYQGRLRQNYETNHHWYAPVNHDQWPEDAALRPGMIHITANIIKPAVDTEARLEAILPRIKNVPDIASDEMRLRSEAAEKLMIRFLELSGWEVWLQDLTKCKALYSKGILKTFWNKADARPDVVIVENPGNLRIGWGTSDFRVMDWTIYEYSISPIEAMRRFPDITIVPSRGNAPLIVTKVGDHADPIGNVDPEMLRSQNYIPSDYERKQVSCWDYWFKDGEGKIKNAIFVNQVLATKITTHDYLPDLPYIIVEHEHEPGSPEGMSLVEDLIDIQIELNRALSHWAQLVADEIDPAWQVDADNIPPGTVPKGGQIVPAGEGHQIRALEKPVNQIPLQSLIAELFKVFHFVSGLSEILFTMPPGAQTAGRALTIQIEASNNRIDPRRQRLYRGLYELLVFWSFMIEKINPKVLVGTNEDGTPKKAGLKDIVADMRRWKFGAPEITPRDIIENTNNVIQKVNAKMVSLEDGMDELGVDAPLEQIKKIMIERTNPALFPGDSQAYAAVLNLLSQMQLQQQQQQVVGQAGSIQDKARAALVAQQQGAQPTYSESENEPAPQPATVPGGPAPISNQTLIRPTPAGGAAALQQITLR